MFPSLDNNRLIRICMIIIAAIFSFWLFTAFSYAITPPSDFPFYNYLLIPSILLVF